MRGQHPTHDGIVGLRNHLGSSALITRICQALVFLLIADSTAWAADSDALWKIITGPCTPCVQKTTDTVVMKDRNGIAQYLLLPTARITGIESPQILDDNSPNYWAAAWAARTWVEQKLQHPIARDWLSLTINSAYGRTQNQLHIHVDCLAADVHDALATQMDAIGPNWHALATPLKNHPYWAKRLDSPDLKGINPFIALADGIPAARQHMDQQTLIAIGANFKDGHDGFILLTDHADLANADRASGEEVQDHDCRF